MTKVKSNEQIALELRQILNSEGLKSFHYDFFSKDDTRTITVSWVDDMGYRSSITDEWED